MATGTIKWFDPAQGFGFIKPDDAVNEVFLHVSELEKAGIGFIDKFAIEGLSVAYDVGTNKHGKPAAIDVKLNVDVVTKTINGIKTGVIKWWSETKGYGFIAQRNSNKDVFVHFSELAKAKVTDFTKKNLMGVSVDYEVFVDVKGRTSAVNISFLEKQ